MRIFANKGGETSGESGIQVGKVTRVLAEGAVKIEQDGQIATSEQVTFFPAEQRAVLTGAPKVTNGEAVIVGQRMELQPMLAIVDGDESQPVVVTLPEMPDLGYDPFPSEDAATTPAAATSTEHSPEADLARTVIRSRMLRMVEEPDQTIFRFTDSVEVSATNLEASCGRLEVIAKEAAAAADGEGLGEALEVERIEAHEAVEIRQAGRIATAGKAFILPKEGKVVLEEDAVVNDDRGRVSGHRMTLLQGQRRAIVEGGGGPGQERARITLPGLPPRD
jgi:lipopolysaccharide export system protein LptA